MAYTESLRGAGAPLLTPPQARLMAQQIFGGPKVSCRQFSLKGAFQISRVGFWETLLIDGNALLFDQWNLLRKPATLHEAYVTVNVNTQTLLDFRSPLSSVVRSSTRSSFYGTRTFTIPILEMKGDTWCLAALHAGLMPKGKTVDEALTLYEAKFAKSAHDSFAMRQRMAEQSA